MAAAIEDPSVFKVKKAFDLLKEAMEEDQDNLIDKVRGIYCFKVKNSDGKEGMWIINAKTGKGNVTYNGKGIFNPYPNVLLFFFFFCTCLFL